jgi:hypothetical protein
MTTASSLPTPAAPPQMLLESLLRLAPLDVLLFDQELICRYAALTDGTLLGRTADQFLGEHAESIFDPEHGDLRTALRLSAESAGRYEYPSYRYAFSGVETQTFYCWSVRVEPLLLIDYRGREEFRGVLVTLADVQDLADERDRLRAGEERLLAENAVLHVTVADLGARLARAEGSLRDAQERVRTLLAPVSGYLQLIARRPDALRDETPQALIEREVLTRLHDLIAAVDNITGRDPPRPAGTT